MKVLRLLLLLLRLLPLRLLLQLPLHLFPGISNPNPAEVNSAGA